ncbi:MAG: helix-turn-helix transcriptional regulator [Bacteroidetes bacterium]|nr:helix-turn-helix transcriptional regulator [Bacteroidota bacterium]
MKQNPKATAYDLYFKTNLTQAQIAERAGVSTRTLYDWMKQGNWKTLKANSRLMPAQIVDDIYNHISHLNWKIKTRDFEDRYPSKEEAETLRKLISAIPKIKLNVSKGESAQSMINFVSWLQTRNNDAAIFISDYIDEYLHAGREKGLEPYEFEYDADQYYNPTDYPWRKEHTFEQRVSEEKNPLLRGDVPQTTDVVSEQGCVQSGPPPQPDQGTDQKNRHPELVSGPYENTDNLPLSSPRKTLHVKRVKDGHIKIKYGS